MKKVIENCIKQSIADKTKLSIVGRQTRTSASGDIKTLSLLDYCGVIKYQPQELLLTVKAGTAVADICQLLDENEQALPCLSAKDKGTVGGCYAMGGGQGEQKLRDYVLGIDIIDGQARQMRFGGEMLKNVAGFDVARLLIGSKGRCAVVTQISFRLLPKNLLTTLNNNHYPNYPQTKTAAIAVLEKKIKTAFDPHGVFG